MDRTQAYRLAGTAGCVGGLLWVLASAGHTFSHGSTQEPREATVLGFESIDYYRLLAIPALLFIVGLVVMESGRTVPRPRPPRGGLVTSLVGWAMVGIGVVLETWVINPDEDFEHPLVLLGWVLFILGLLPVVPVGMGMYGSGFTDEEQPLGWLVVVTGFLAALQWLEVLFAPWSTGSLGWDIVYSIQRGAVGVGWLILGGALWMGAGRRTSQPAARYQRS